MPILQLINVLQVSHLKLFRMLILTTYNELEGRIGIFPAYFRLIKVSAQIAKNPLRAGSLLCSL